MVKIKKEVIKAYALKNAISHNGKAQPGAIIAGLFNHGLKKDKIKEIMPEIQKVIKEIGKMNLESQKEEFSKWAELTGQIEVREGMPELDDVKGKVIMRFSPSASGPFHIGHALTASTSFLYVQKYGGKLYVRIEDTNPENSFKDSYNLIKKDSEWLFNGKADVVVQSNRMKLYYKYIEKLIKKNSAYVCTCTSENFREFVAEQKDCPCRALDSEEQLSRWKKMLDKKGFKQGEAVLRFKSGMKQKNPAMRDFPLARINTTPHPLQSKKYKVWPLMNLAVTVDDIELKMTHIIRAKDHRDNAKRQEMIYKVLGKKPPKSYFLGRIHLKDMELSTTKIREAIKKGIYKGWDDAKLPTLQSLKKQGYKPEAFHKFAEQIGLNEVDKTIDKKEFFLLLDKFNRD